MNKKRMILLAMMLLIALSGCAGSGNSGKSLYEHGMDVIALMEEMVGSSSYGSLMSDAAEIEQMRQSLAAGDYAAPQAVYEIEVPTMGDILAYAESENGTISSNMSISPHSYILFFDKIYSLRRSCG